MIPGDISNKNLTKTAVLSMFQHANNTEDTQHQICSFLEDLKKAISVLMLCTPVFIFIYTSILVPRAFSLPQKALGTRMIYIRQLSSFRVVTKLDTPKSDYRESTGTEWLVLGLGLGLGSGLVVS